ncbi:MAG: sulfatase [Verrucomicrobiota bacterium]|nr:sulfatase [Verrucomicrobiota bacterium]
MSRLIRQFCFLLVAIATVFPSSGWAEKRPNIVLILADDLGWMDLHCQGNLQVDTPHLDALALKGIRCTNGYASAPVCTPTRASIMTGLSPARLHITNHAPGNPDYSPPGSTLRGARWTTHLDLGYKTLAEYLGEAGYTTGFVGKWHLSHHKGRDAEGPLEPRLRPEHQGFDLNVGGCDYGGPPSYFEPYRIPNIPPRKTGDYLPERLADECISFLDQQVKDPFFLCWWNYSVHYPIQAPEHLIEKYRKKKSKRPAYLAMIEGMDKAIGRVLDHLEQTQLNSNTLVVFTSDNGSLFENTPLRASKGYLYEGGIRVPWIIQWPGRIPSGVVEPRPVISTDLFPTFLEAAGIALPEKGLCDGKSLIPLWTGKDPFTRDALFFHYPNYAFHKDNRLGSAIRVGEFKLIQYYDGSPVELYDLAHDAGETRDLAATTPSKAMELQGRLREWLKQMKAHMPLLDGRPAK